MTNTEAQPQKLQFKYALRDSTSLDLVLRIAEREVSRLILITGVTKLPELFRGMRSMNYTCPYSWRTSFSLLQLYSAAKISTSIA